MPELRWRVPTSPDQIVTVSAAHGLHRWWLWLKWHLVTKRRVYSGYEVRDD